MKMSLKYYSTITIEWNYQLTVEYFLELISVCSVIILLTVW